MSKEGKKRYGVGTRTPCKYDIPKCEPATLENMIEIYGSEELGREMFDLMHSTNKLLGRPNRLVWADSPDDDKPRPNFGDAN